MNKFQKWFRWQCRRFIFWAFSDRVKVFQVEQHVSREEIRLGRGEEFLEEVMKYDLYKMALKEGFAKMTCREDPINGGRIYKAWVYFLK